MVLKASGKWPFGKHKGKRIDRSPTEYLQWMVDNAEDDEIVSLCRSIIEQRDVDQRPLYEQSAAPVEDDGPTALNAKQLADNMVVAFAYVWQGLDDLGLNNKSAMMIEAVQKMATSVAIHAADNEIDLRAELGKHIRVQEEPAKELP